MANYAILPMMNMSISQGRYGNYSHKNLNAYDLNGEDGTRERFRAPCEVVLARKLPKETTGFANTLIYQSTEKVDFADGRKEYVTFALTHCNNINEFVLNKIYKQWDVIYYEGMTGKATGNHVHFEIGLGRQTNKYKDSHGNWCLRNLLNIEDVLFWDKSKTRFCNSGNKGYTFKELPKDNPKEGEPKTNPSLITRNKKLNLVKCPLYATSATQKIANYLTGVYYVHDSKILRGRVRITNKENAIAVTGWIDKKYAE